MEGLENRDRLHSDLVKLGDMMGDGLHLEPDGKWISKEYRRIAKALNLIPAKKRDVAGINIAMGKAIKGQLCKCGGRLKQTRSGSKRAKCVECFTKYQFKFKAKK